MDKGSQKKIFCFNDTTLAYNVDIFSVIKGDTSYRLNVKINLEIKIFFTIFVFNTFFLGGEKFSSLFFKILRAVMSVMLDLIDSSHCLLYYYIPKSPLPRPSLPYY